MRMIDCDIIHNRLWFFLIKAKYALLRLAAVSYSRMIATTLSRGSLE